MRLTHFQHICIQHAKGWDELFRMFPFLKGRRDRALSIQEKYDSGDKSVVYENASMLNEANPVEEKQESVHESLAQQSFDIF